MNPLLRMSSVSLTRSTLHTNLLLFGLLIPMFFPSLLFLIFWDTPLLEIVQKVSRKVRFLCLET